jgi:hypothetical protein
MAVPFSHSAYDRPKLEAEPVEKFSPPPTAYTRGSNPALIRFDRKLVFQLIEQTHTLGIVGGASRPHKPGIPPEDYGGTVSAQSAHCNFVNGADACRRL